MDLIIAECPYCGCRRYSWDKQDALGKLAIHKCSVSLSDSELSEILDKIRRADELKAVNREV